VVDRHGFANAAATVGYPVRHGVGVARMSFI